MVEDDNLRADIFLVDLFQLGDLSGIWEKFEIVEQICSIDSVMKSNTEIYQA